MMTDDEVNAAMRVAAMDKSKRGHDAARCIMTHRHYKVLYERNPQDIKLNLIPVRQSKLLRSAKIWT